MRVAIVSYFKAAYGGNFISEMSLLADYISINNNSVFFIFPYEAMGREWCNELALKGYNVIFIALNRKYLDTYKELSSICKREKIDIIYSNFGSYDVPSALVSLFHHQIKHFINARSAMQEPCNFKRKLFRYIRNKLIYSRSTVISIGKDISNEYLTWGFSKDRINPPLRGIDFERLVLGEDRNTIRSRFGIKENDMVFLMMGYNIEIKGIDIALESFSLAKRKDVKNEYVLAIVVASHLDEMNDFIVKKYSRIPSWVKLLPPNNNVGEYYRLSDFFISASRTEGFSTAVGEAIRMKLPVIISDIASTQWSIKYRSVKQFISESSEDLYNAIITYSCDEAIKEESAELIYGDLNILQWVKSVSKILGIE